jgi:hypothetical protein
MMEAEEDVTNVTIGIKEIALGFSMTELTTIAGGGLKRSLHGR